MLRIQFPACFPAPLNCSRPSSRTALRPSSRRVKPNPPQSQVLEATAHRLADNYPYFHPLYAGQMLKPPHPVARAAYALAMTINPNNHARDGGRASSEMEIEAVRGIAAMFGWGRTPRVLWDTSLQAAPWPTWKRCGSPAACSPGRRLPDCRPLSRRTTRTTASPPCSSSRLRAFPPTIAAHEPGRAGSRAAQRAMWAPWWPPWAQPPSARSTPCPRSLPCASKYGFRVHVDAPTAAISADSGCARRAGTRRLRSNRVRPTPS
jgi:hypothetical protein